jgi:phosphatidylinositol alpha-1,6-mannosyltransferase
LERAKKRVPPIDLLRARVDLERFHPGAPGDAARRELGLTARDKVILCFGRLVPRKGVDRLIAVLPRVQEKVPEAAVVIAGTGPEEKKLRRMAAGSATSDRVIFAGRVSDEDAPGIYAAADIFSLPVVDRWFGLEIEGLGVVLLEAAACGVPCVTGNSGGTPEAVVNGRTGYVVDAADPDQLATRIIELLEDPTKARDMGRAGRAHVEEHFSQRALAPKLAQWLDGKPLDG